MSESEEGFRNTLRIIETNYLVKDTNENTITNLIISVCILVTMSVVSIVVINKLEKIDNRLDKLEKNKAVVENVFKNC